MSGTAENWAEFERWNKAIVDVVFSPKVAGTPVFLDLEDDLEDDVFDSIARAAAGSTEGAKAEFIQIVRRTLVLNHGPAAALRGHLNRLDAWRLGDQLDPPPSLGLLAVLSLAAEDMHDGEGFAANNYYSRLAELMGMSDEEKECFISAYRKSHKGRPASVHLWSSLNDWLDRLEGARGLPTAFAVSHLHIGPALSQALVRQTDRERFSSMFALYGLPPHGSLAPVDMRLIIDEWMSKDPCPASNTLARMWKDARARDRIVDVACLTLEAWDGADEAPTGHQVQGPRTINEVKALAHLRTFPSPRLDLSLVIPARKDEPTAELEVLDPADTVAATIGFSASAGSWLVPSLDQAIDSSSFLAGVTRLRRAGEGHERQRRPRRLVPMRKDDLLQAYVEVERVQLGGDCMVLAHADIAPVVGDALEVAARPGFCRYDDIPGLPDGWVLFANVQILAAISEEQLKGKLIDLNLLQPLATSQLSIQGGMSLPGNVRKWSVRTPPEIRASTAEGGSLRCTITCTRAFAQPTPRDRDRSEGAPVLVWDLNDEHLPDGDYRIELFEDDSTTPIHQSTLRLRSADEPAVVLGDDELLAHDPRSADFTYSAAPAAGDEQIIGAWAPEPATATMTAEPARSLQPRWLEARKNPSAQPSAGEVGLAIAYRDDKSCITTGAHHWNLPTAGPGPQPKLVDGVCRNCGMVRRYRTHLRGGNKRAKATPAKVRAVDVSRIDAVRIEDAVDWNAGFDAVCHVSLGTIAHLERIALQMEPSGYFTDTLARRLEALGHLEIQRDPQTLAPLRWRVAPPTLAQAADGSWFLAGARCERLLCVLEDHAYKSSWTWVVERDIDGPDVVRLISGDDDEIPSLIDDVEHGSGTHATIAPDASRRLLAALPPLSDVVGSLPTTAIGKARGYERWNPVTARFEKAADVSGAGAFRLHGFSRTYLYRSTADAEAGRSRAGDPRLIKYAAALESGIHLLGYQAGDEVLYAPLGANLPGLYGRAAVLASGCPPIERPQDGTIEYHGVPADIAGRLSDLLMS